MIKKILLIALFSTSLSVSAKVPKYAYITDTVDVALRSDRSFNNNIIRALTTGDKVKIVRHFDGWTQIHYGGETGWMMSRYLKNSQAINF